MAIEAGSKPVTEQPFEPVVVHFKTLEFIWGTDGFKNILSKIPAFVKATSELPHSFWDFGGRVDLEMDGRDLFVELELNGKEGRTILDVEMESVKEGLRDAYLTLIDPAPVEGNKDGERSSFHYFGINATEPIADTHTAETGIKELKEMLRSLIPPSDQ